LENTTKELIAAVLATQGALKTGQLQQRNWCPYLLELAPHDYAVIEMGMRAREKSLCPTIVITNVGTAHIGLGSKEAILQTKCELLAEMPQTALQFSTMMIPI